MAGFNRIKFHNKIQGCSPDEFISLIKYADYVVTTSFHGTTLSVIFEKEFYSIDTGGANRQMSLLESLGIKERFISDVNSVDLEHLINYENVIDKLSELRKTSIKYLECIEL